jgi:transcriptional regulator with XRE-family HTH domain
MKHMEASNEKQRTATSQALIELRKAMGLSQQRFAVEIMNVAVPTIGRWESNAPPESPEALERLAAIAYAMGDVRIGSIFLKARFDGIVKRWRDLNAEQYFPQLVRANGESYVFTKLEGEFEFEAMRDLLMIFKALRGNPQQIAVATKCVTALGKAANTARSLDQPPPTKKERKKK